MGVCEKEKNCRENQYQIINHHLSLATPAASSDKITSLPSKVVWEGRIHFVKSNAGTRTFNSAYMCISVCTCMCLCVEYLYKDTFFFSFSNPFADSSSPGNL